MITSHTLCSSGIAGLSTLQSLSLKRERYALFKSPSTGLVARLTTSFAITTFTKSTSNITALDVQTGRDPCEHQHRCFLTFELPETRLFESEVGCRVRDRCQDDRKRGVNLDAIPRVFAISQWISFAWYSDGARMRDSVSCATS
jgi:hypothetical protein